MATYVDGFVIPVPKSKVAAYRSMAKKAAAIWMEHGAIAYRECVGDDIQAKVGPGFHKGVGARRNDVIFFSYIEYKSRAHRDSVNKKVMQDPRIEGMCDPKDMPFDCNRMLYGGFKAVVESQSKKR